MRYLAAFFLVAAAGCGGSGTKIWHVHPDGSIGPLQIDASTEAQIRSFAGKPFKVEKDFNGAAKFSGHSLSYRCGRGCITTYSISKRTGKLSDYWTQSPRFVTDHGSHAGMSAAKAATAERRKLVRGCGFPWYVHLRWDRGHAFVLAVFKGKIDSIGYLGPHTVYYEGLC